MKTKIVKCHTADSKPVKQEVSSTVILTLEYSLFKGMIDALPTNIGLR